MLYAAGHFDTAGNIPANNIAKWDGVAWSPLGTGINDRVSALISYNGSLYAGGNFTAAGGNAARSIAKWDGVNWSPLGTGINDYGVFCLAVYKNSLYAGGWFTQAGGVTTRSLAKWDETNWSSVGNVVGEAVLSLFTYNDTLYTGGSLNPQQECIAKWDGISWSSIGNGIGDYHGASVWSINEYNGDIYAGGGFQTAGHVQVNNFAKWTNQCSIAPLKPGNINGNTTVCQNNYVTYSIGAVNDAADFTWTLPPGWSGSSVSNTITALVGSNGGAISVVANNPCGSSSAQTLMVTVLPSLSQPGNISGNDTVCVNSFQTYSISPISGATSYTWYLPFDWIGSSTTNTITAFVGEWSGEIIVFANNDHCSSDPQSFFVTANYFNLPQPGAINGNNSVCPGSTQTYFVNAVPGATSYTWNIPAGWSGNSITNSITVTTGSNSGRISVRANNACGNGGFEYLQVFLDTIPPKMAPINGNAYVTAGEKHGYSVDATSRPSGYNWSLSGGGNLTAGQSPHKVEIDWQTPGTYVLSVNAVNSCGVSTEQKMNIIVSIADEKDPYDLQLVPNPSTGIFFLNAKRLQAKWVSVEVINMSGQLVLSSGKRSGTNDYSQLIDLDKLAQGIYAVKIRIDDNVYTKQVLITN